MITIFTRPFCPYCAVAKHFLKKQGQDFQEHTLKRGSEQAEQISQLSGITSVPQIFNGEVSKNTCIGGYDDMMAKYEAGEIFN